MSRLEGDWGNGSPYRIGDRRDQSAPCSGGLSEAKGVTFCRADLSGKVRNIAGNHLRREGGRYAFQVRHRNV